MKLKYLFPLFIATLALMTSCAEEDQVTMLSGIKVSSSYVSLPVEGGSTTITLTVQDSWKIREKEIEVEVEGGEEGETEKKIVLDIPEWLTLSATSGNAGETELTFSAESTLDGRNGEIVIESGNEAQRINIIQGLAEVSEATVAEVNAGPDGKTFRVTGVCTSIANTLYGNWYITDDTGSLYIYGTLDKDNKDKNFLSLGLEVGDEVTVEGPKLTYGTTIELVNVTVIKINKSLVKVDSVENEVLPLEGGEFTAHLTCKGQGVSVEIPDNAKDWLSISSIQSAGTNSVVKFKAAKNNGGDRSVTITFRTTDGKKEYTTETTLTQEGSIVAATIAEFLAAEVGDTQYRLTGVITSIAQATYGNLYLRDFSGETYVYGIQDFKDKGLKVGDIITIVGKRAAYKETPQVAGAVLESVIPVTLISIADVLTKPDSKETYYLVTGEITEIKDPVYGNLYLKDGDSNIFVYGCYPGYGATGDYRKNLLETKGIKVGDKLTVIGTKTTYSGTIQLANGIYFSHESAQ